MIENLENEVLQLRAEVAELKQVIQELVYRTPNTPGPIPGRRCTVHVNCSGGSMYCNDGGPITDPGIGW